MRLKCLEILAAGLLQPIVRAHVQPLNLQLFTLSILMSKSPPAAAALTLHGFFLSFAWHKLFMWEMHSHIYIWT